MTVKSLNMTQAQKYFLQRPDHKIAYRAWGDDNAPAIIGVHGLTGNGSDFDFLAPALVEKDYRVIAVDLAGRGESDFLKNPLDYNYDVYCADLLALLSHLDLRAVDWIGISLGGLLGIKLAGMGASPIRRLIINDVGPEVPKMALDFIHQVISQSYEFDDVTALETRMRATRGLTWGKVTDEQWAHMAAHNARALPNGKVTYAYDPAIAKIFETQPTGDENLWPYWENINVPVLLLWGKKSMILTKKIIKQMKKSGPAFDLHTFKDCGHVPSLMAPGQIEVVTDWLQRDDNRAFP